MKVKGLTLAVALLLAGCAAKRQANECQLHGASAASCQWYLQVQQNIQRNFVTANHYVGQKCLVTAGRNAQGRLNVLRTEGDEALCLKAWHTIGSLQQWPLPPKGAPEIVSFAFEPH